MLNIVLLITCVFTVILLLLYLFYWNRVLALGISILLRIAFWNQAESSIWLDIGMHALLYRVQLSQPPLRFNSVLRDSGQDSVQGPPVLFKQPDHPSRQGPTKLEVLDPKAGRRG